MHFSLTEKASAFPGHFTKPTALKVRVQDKIEYLILKVLGGVLCFCWAFVFCGVFLGFVCLFVVFVCFLAFFGVLFCFFVFFLLYLMVYKLKRFTQTPLFYLREEKK